MPTPYWLCSTFLRFQEFYESPNPAFRGHGFSLEEFQDWYAVNRPHGEFSYYTDWGGFNFPSYVVKRFTGKLFGPLSRKESWVLSQLPRSNKRFYVIGTYQDGDGRNYIQHEVVHGLFYLYPGYAKKVTGIVQEYDFTAFKRELRAMGYCEEVLIDEINAYLTTGLCPSLTGKDGSVVRRCRPRLIRAFSQQFGFDVSKKKPAAEYIKRRIHHIDGDPIRARA